MKEKSFVYSKTDEIINLSKDGKVEDVSCQTVDRYLLYFSTCHAHNAHVSMVLDLDSGGILGIQGEFRCHQHGSTIGFVVKNLSRPCHETGMTGKLSGKLQEK